MNLRSIFHRSKLEAEMRTEMQFHIDTFAADLIKQGVPRDEALRRARLEFGPIEAKKEECRESLGLRLFDELSSDLRYAFRMIRQNPGFTAIAVVSLGLGVGANTAIFTLAREVLLKTMGVPHSDRLRMLSWTRGQEANFGPIWGNFAKNAAGELVGTSLPYPLFLEMQRHNEVLDDLVAVKDGFNLTATVNGQAESVSGELVSGNFYQSLAPKVIAGRPIVLADDSTSATPVVVISAAYWARRFGRSADALGQTIALNRVPLTIIGVNGPEFTGAKAGSTPEVFFPLSLQPQVIPNEKGSLLANHGYWWVPAMGRLKSGVTDQAATAALQLSFRNAFHATLPDKKDTDMPRLFLASGSRGMDIQTQSFAKPIYLLLGLAGLVLLIACANLANLLLARSSARQREMSLRLAMGASRLRIMRQVLTEAMLLAAMGGGAGLLLGYWGRNLIPSLFGDSWHPSGIDPRMDWRVFLFAFIVTACTGLLFGVAPAWRSTRADVNAGLKETGRMTTTRPKAILGKALVAFQVALSLLLVLGAGLFLRTLSNLRLTELGFNPERILLFDLNPPRSFYPAKKRVPLFESIAEKVSALPGIQAATLSGEPLLANSMDNDCYHPTTRPAGGGNKDMAWTNSVGSNFFETLAIPILNGRSFTARDNQHSPRVAIINQRLAKAFFPNANPVGQTIISCDAGTTPVEIIGVSADAKYSSLRDEVPPTIYFAYLQDNDAAGMTFELKTAASTASLVPEIREAIRSVDPDLPLLEVRTQTQQINATLSNERVFATLSTGFGVLALILASIGIYGVMTYTVSRRINEIGIRMALGARSSAVLGMILRETLLLTLAGVMGGLAAAYGLARLTASMLYGVKPTDPVTFAGAALLLVLVALAAGFTPANRAAKVDPMTALRHE